MAKKHLSRILKTSFSKVSFITWIASILIVYASLYVGVRTEWAGSEILYLLAAIPTGTVAYIIWIFWIVNEYVRLNHKKKQVVKYKASSVLLGFVIAYIVAQGTWLLLPEDYSPPEYAESQDVEKVVCDEEVAKERAKDCTVLVLTDLGHGSGFAIEDNFVVTNSHVIEGARYIKVDGQGAGLWGYSEESDLAVLKVDYPLSPCSWADSDNIALAETLHAIGFPFSPEGESSFTRGIYSRSILTEEGPVFIQTDTPINPGNSGGPLINRCGVVGVNTLKFSWTDDLTPLEGFGFAIASNYAERVVSRLIQNGEILKLPVGNIDYPEYTPEKYYEGSSDSSQSGYSQSTVDSWVLARDETRSMKKKWETTTGNYDKQKHDELKDLLARMSAVVETIVPKIMGQELLSNEELRLLEEWESMYTKATSLENELEGDSYQQYDYSIPEYHYTCQDLACKRVEGKGEDECFLSIDCYHYECQDSSCKKVAGPGDDQCYSDYGCE